MRVARIITYYHSGYDILALFTRAMKDVFVDIALIPGLFYALSFQLKGVRDYLLQSHILKFCQVQYGCGCLISRVEYEQMAGQYTNTKLFYPDKLLQAVQNEPMTCARRGYL